MQHNNDFGAVEWYWVDKYFNQALGVGGAAVVPTLRQRPDPQARAMFEHMRGAIERPLGCRRPDCSVLAHGWLQLKVGNFAMANGGRDHEGESRTPTPVVRSYASWDGYCPQEAHLGLHGFCTELALRTVVQLSARAADSTWGG